MSLTVDGIIGSSAVDSSGEILSVKGCDISSLEVDGVLNFEHQPVEGGSFNSIVGKCVKAKKIYSKSDCANAREEMYWEKTKLPFIYGVFRLFDGAGHENAMAAAAIMRDQHKHGEDQILRLSIEGSTLSQKGNLLEETIARAVALTRKPCNKTAITGILSDPEATSETSSESTDSLASLLDTKKGESDIARKLTSVLFTYIPFEDEDTTSVTNDFLQKAQQVIDLAKALEGGSYNAAPSTLTGGACLQREDLGEANRRRLVNVTKAAIRDHDPAVHGPFKPYLKALLPEASDEFLDRFTELSDELSVNANLKAKYLQKTSPQVQIAPEHQSDPNRSSSAFAGANAPRAGALRSAADASYQESLARIHTARETAFPDEDAAGIIPPASTEAFENIPAGPIMKRGGSVLNEETGVLYVPSSSKTSPARIHKLYAPSVNDSHYMQHLTDPGINAIHDRAMKNWVLMNRLNRSGKLPPEVIAHAGLFSLMSPNCAVPIQELAFGHLMDMKAKGWDPTKAYPREQTQEYEQEFMNLASGQALPQFMHDHFLSDQAAIWRKPNAAELAMGTRKDPEERIRHVIGLPEGKWSGAANYHDLHTFLANLVKEHGTDAAAISGKLNALKDEKEKLGSRTYTAKKAGKPAPTDPNADKPEVYRFAPKTIRYMLGMLGAGNVVVPDTHFLRHTFGLHPDDPRIGDVKASILQARHEPLLQGVDRWYRANHPSFEWTRQKLQKQYGEDFGDQATFPAFWLHWLTIAPHERTCKWNTSASSSEGTDHGVYWNSVHNILDKYGLPHDPHDPSLRKKEHWQGGGTIPARTAHAMKEIENRFGETAASLAYYTYLAPLLLAPSKSATLYKAELLERLMKGEHSEESSAPKLHMHQGHAVEPGEVLFHAGPKAGQTMPLIALGKDFHHVLGDNGELMRLKANHPNIRVTRPPKLARTNTTVDSKIHGHPTLHGTQIQHDIINGLDMAQRVSEGKVKGVTAKQDASGEVGWYKSGEGHLVYVKPAPEDLLHVPEATEDPGFGLAHREAAFSRLADEFFGMGEHVPPTTVFRHPVNGSWHSAQKRVEGEHYSPTSMYQKESLGQMARVGTLDKLALMDNILGQGDRHVENSIISPDGRTLSLIDNGLSFAPKTQHNDAYIPPIAHYWKQGHKYNDGATWYNKPLHPDVVAWVNSLDQQKFAEHMDRLGIPKSLRDESVRRLTAIKQRTARGLVSRSGAWHAPFISPVPGHHRAGEMEAEGVGMLSRPKPSMPQNM